MLSKKRLIRAAVIFTAGALFANKRDIKFNMNLDAPKKETKNA